MHPSTPRNPRPRPPLGIVPAGLLATALALLPAPVPDVTAWLGAAPARAQGPS